MSDTDRMKRELAKQQKVRAARLDQARRAAEKTGKESFDFDKLAALVDVSSFWGHGVHREARARELEEDYYLTYREVRTLAELAERLREREPFEP